MYALNNESAQAARKAEQRTSFIDEKGKYVGKFTRAEDITAASGTRGIAFTFETDDGQKANFSIYTIKSDGEKLGDYGTLMALMTCLGVKDIRPAQVTSLVWDRDAGGNVNKELIQFPELLNKRVGILLAMEEYEKRDQSKRPTGETGWSVRLNAVFQADTELTASEILDRKTTPTKLPQLVAALKDRPLKNKPHAASSGASHPIDGGGFDGGGAFDDSIPFAPAFARAAWAIA
jgi:hypothetical protein